MRSDTFTVIPQNMRPYEMSVRTADVENDLFREAVNAALVEDPVSDIKTKMLAIDFFKYGWEAAVVCLNDDKTEGGTTTPPAAYEIDVDAERTLFETWATGPESDWVATAFWRDAMGEYGDPEIRREFQIWMASCRARIGSARRLTSESNMVESANAGRPVGNQHHDPQSTPSTPKIPSRYMDQLDAGVAGEEWLHARLAGSVKMLRSEEPPGGQSPRVKWVVLLDQHDCITYGYMLTRDLMNWTQLILIEGRVPRAADTSLTDQDDRR